MTFRAHPFFASPQAYEAWIRTKPAICWADEKGELVESQGPYFYDRFWLVVRTELEAEPGYAPYRAVYRVPCREQADLTWFAFQEQVFAAFVRTPDGRIFEDNSLFQMRSRLERLKEEEEP